MEVKKKKNTIVFNLLDWIHSNGSLIRLWRYKFIETDYNNMILEIGTYTTHTDKCALRAFLQLF